MDTVADADEPAVGEPERALLGNAADDDAAATFDPDGRAAPSVPGGEGDDEASAGHVADDPADDPADALAQELAEELSAVDGAAVTRLSLALANTQYLLRGAVTDRIATVDDLRGWLLGLGRSLATDLPETDLDGTSHTDVVAVGELRHAIRSMAGAVINGQILDPEDVAVLNRRLSLVPRWTELAVGEQGAVTTRARSTASAVPAAVAEIAADAVALFADPRARQALAACGGPGCLNVFLRAWSDQQWCSARCANRLQAVREDALARGRHS